MRGWELKDFCGDDALESITVERLGRGALERCTIAATWAAAPLSLWLGIVVSVSTLPPVAPAGTVEVAVC